MNRLIESFATSYHGTIDKWADSIYNKIDLDSSELRYVADFGKGFYVTNEFQRARAWARSKRDFVLFRGKYNLGEICPAVVKMNINIGALSELEGTILEELNVEWARFIYHCRREGFRHRIYHSNDYVCGWIADKNVAKLSKLIMNGETSGEQFLAHILPNLSFGQQYQLSLNTSRAIQCIMEMEVIYV